MVIAIINGHYDVAALLLEKGADPNVADSVGMAALYAAVDMHTLDPLVNRPPTRVSGSVDAVEMVRLLLQHRARSTPGSRRRCWRGSTTSAIRRSARARRR